jgi:RNA polymerase sigma factor (TIGR02999 family)
MEFNHEITRILVEWDRDPRDAIERLTPLVYDELRLLAASCLKSQRPGHTLQPTALVHEAYLRLAGQESIAWKDRGHFFGIAARAMRLILVDSARRHFSQKRGSGKKVELEDEIEYCQARADEFLDLNDAIEALQKWDERKHGVLEMKYFGGMSREQIAEALGVSLGTVKRDLTIAEAFLRRELAGALPGRDRQPSRI